MKKGRCFIMCFKLKRVLSFVSAVVIGGVSCVTTWFSVPVSAAGAFGMLEWLEFQTLLQGIGIGGNNSDFADSVDTWIDGIGGPEMPREEYDGKWMTNYEYYNRLGWDEIVNWFDGLFSGDNAYSDIADVGANVSGNISFPNCSSLFSLDGVVLFSGSDSYLLNSEFFWYRPKSGFIASVFLVSDGNLPSIYIASSRSDKFSFSTGSDGILSWRLSDGSISSGSAPVWSTDKFDQWGHVSSYSSYSDLLSSVKSFGVTHVFDSVSEAINFLNSHTISDWNQLVFDNNNNFIGPVYTYPAAQELYKSTGTAAGIRLDVQTEDGVPDIQAALDGAGVKTVDDLVAGVAAGTVPMSKVFSDAKVTPYVVADTATGAVVTDLGVSATAAGVKAVGLTQELAVPKDLTTAATYPIKGKTWDPDMAKYKLPLFQFFPFCLPWDIYEVLTLFDAEPVAPKFTIPVGQFFTRFSGSVDTSKAADQKAVVDLGADSWQSTFKVIRALECAAIIIGLCLTAVLLIHGGR